MTTSFLPKPTSNMNVLSMSFALIFSLSISVDLSSAAEIPGNEADYRALIAFKSLITDDPLMSLASWNESSHFCSWTGVECGLNIQRVTGLNLTGRRLGGTITALVGNMSLISVLDLSRNSFHGGIPSLGGLGRLSILNVSFNLLHGRIPGDLSNCTNLRNLALDHNFLTGVVPFGLGSLTQLLTLYLGNNNLTGTLPSSLGNLTSLFELDMSYNVLNGEVPSTMSMLENLRTFRVSVNSLSGEFPPVLYNLTTLDFIALSFNNFTGMLREDVGFVLPNLERIWIAYNFFVGPIPKSFSNASKLSNIDLIHNNFTGEVPLSLGHLDLKVLNIGFNSLGFNAPNDLDFVTSLTNCSNLRFLHFGDNKFGGSLPVSIANLSTKLTTLYLEANSIHGNIPKEISNLQSLQTLFMNSNYLNGTIPDSFGKLPSLGRLVLGSNRLTGKIPPVFGNITSLLVLFLFDNMLEGGIPSSLANCKQMVYLYIAQNNLTGTVPHEVLTIPSLLSFNVSYNQLIGSLPENIGNLSHIVEIDLSYNKFSGEITNKLGDCLAMNIISLQGNMFHGRIPDLARLSGLIYLDVSNNNLSGKIPDFLTHISSFITLNLSFNDLEGKVPSFGVFSNLSAIDVRGNSRLCGGIPEMNLQDCAKDELDETHNKHGLKRRNLILIIVLTSSLALSSAFLLLMIWIRSRPKKQTDSEAERPQSLRFFPKISYEELKHATNDFSPQNLIGSGSFGTVYRGTLPSEGPTVAVKVLNLQRRGASRSFLAECEALRSTRHHNLVKVITACSSEDCHGNEFKALVYEFMANGSLDEWLHPEGGGGRRPQLGVVERMDIAIDVAAALHYLHHQCKNAVVHCDLKPQNVLLDGDMSARVGDFGLARLVRESGKRENVEEVSSVGMIKGTIGYAAPEQGMGAKASIPGDVYSYGILLLEIFTGKRPTDGLFTANLSLHRFVKLSVPERVPQILDSSALSGESTWDEAWSGLGDELRDCLIRLLRIGVACSSPSPRERMSMRQVHRELVVMRESVVGVGFEKERRISSIKRGIEFDDEV